MTQIAASPGTGAPRSVCDQHPLHTEPLPSTALSAPLPASARPPLGPGALFPQPSPRFPLTLSLTGPEWPQHSGGKAGSSRGSMELFTHPSCPPCQPWRQSLVWVQMEPSAPCLATAARQRAGLAATASLSRATLAGGTASREGKRGCMEPIHQDGTGTRISPSVSRELRAFGPTSSRPRQMPHKKHW